MMSAGLKMTVTWMVNGVNVQTNQVPAGSATNVAVVLAANLELGTNIVVVTVSDSAGGETSCDSTIIVQDTIAPVITNKTVSPAVLWPPNHKMVPIKISVATQDACCVDKWKIVSTYPSYKWELFDLSNDRGETTDLSSKFPEIVDKLSMEYFKWAEQTGVVDYDKIKPAQPMQIPGSSAPSQSNN